MTDFDETTFAVPRFLALVNLSYLLEAASAADEHLQERLKNKQGRTPDDLAFVGNLNATRQSLLRAVFIASYATVEQNLDEILQLRRVRDEIAISPSDLKDRGIARSMKYAQAVLGWQLSSETTHWKDLLFLQELRNHLVHYGSGFTDSREHETKFRKYSKSTYVTLRPEICFTIDQLKEIFELYVRCVGEFADY